jgi:hypothetical protein
MLHGTFPGRKCTAGNTATATSPGNITGEKAYEFNLWHTIALDDPLEPFNISVGKVEESAEVIPEEEPR